MKLTVYYLAAVVALVVTGVGSLTAMRISRTEVDQVFIGQILGILTPTLAALIVLLRGEDRGAALGAKIDENTNLTLATNDKIDKVVDSAVAPPRMPTRNLPGEFDR